MHSLQPLKPSLHTGIQSADLDIIAQFLASQNWIILIDIIISRIYIYIYIYRSCSTLLPCYYPLPFKLASSELPAWLSGLVLTSSSVSASDVSSSSDFSTLDFFRTGGSLSLLQLDFFLPYICKNKSKFCLS